MGQRDCRLSMRRRLGCGGQGPSIWDQFCHSEKNTTGITGDVSCDFYHHYQEDIRMMAEGGQNTYRFSISWSRIVPKADRVINEKGFEFYDKVLTECEKYGIVPNVTLVHYDLPDYVGDQGGWCWSGISDEFAYYAAAVFRHFGDRIPLYVTINEPTHNASCCYMVGNYPPNEQVNMQHFCECAYNMILCNAKAIREFRKLKLNAKIGLMHASCSDEPCWIRRRIARQWKTAICLRTTGCWIRRSRAKSRRSSSTR